MKKIINFIYRNMILIMKELSIKKILYVRHAKKSNLPDLNIVEYVMFVSPDLIIIVCGLDNVWEKKIINIS